LSIIKGESNPNQAPNPYKSMAPSSELFFFFYIPLVYLTILIIFVWNSSNDPAPSNSNPMSGFTSDPNSLPAFGTGIGAQLVAALMQNFDKTTVSSAFLFDFVKNAKSTSSVALVAESLSQAISHQNWKVKLVCFLVTFFFFCAITFTFRELFVERKCCFLTLVHVRQHLHNLPQLQKPLEKLL